MAFRDVSYDAGSTAAIQSPSGYPVSNRINAIASVTVTKGQAVFSSMSKLAKNCEEASTAVLSNRIQDIRVWRQKAEGVLLASWNRLFQRSAEFDQ